MTDVLRQARSTDPASRSGPTLPQPGPSVTFTLERADDNLTARVFMYDMDTVPTPTRWTLAPAPGKTGILIVKLSPQHIMEYADTSANPAPPQPSPVYGPPSLVVFTVPPGTAPFELSVEGVLAAIAELPLQVAAGVPTVRSGSGAVRDAAPGGADVLAARLARAAARAVDPASLVTVTGTGSVTGPDSVAVPPGEDDDGPPSPAPPPLSSVTSLAVPSRLRMSPAGGDTRFRHAASPVERGGSVELWHSRLSVRRADGSHVEAEVPAVVHGPVVSSATEVDEVWNGVVGDVFFQNPLTNETAKLIAARAKSPTTATTAPLDLRELVLSPLGATLDVAGRWPGQNPAAYRHHVVLGRDDEVRIESDGVLYPFGHEARMTQTTRRVPVDDHDATPAVLVTRTVLRVRKPVVEYDAGDRIGRSFPWKRIEIVNRTSPAGTKKVRGFGTSTVEVAGAPFRSACVAVDHAGHVGTFTLPLLFVPSGTSQADARSAWKQLGDEFARIELHGQALGVAPAAGGSGAPAGQAGSADATTLLTNVVRLGDVAASPGGLRPQVSFFTGISPALGTLAGQAERTFEYAVQYLDAAFAHTGPANAPINPGELVLTVGETLVNAAADAAGLASIPQLPIRGISRAVGAVAAASSPLDPKAVTRNLAKAALNQFDPQAYFGDLRADLFGIFDLKELLKEAGSALELARDAPRQVVETVDGLRKVTVGWSATLVRDGKSFSPAGRGFLSLTAENGDITLKMSSVTSTGVDGRVTSHTTTKIANATLELGVEKQQLITLPIPSIVFESTDGAAPTVDVQLGKVDFLGPLAFVKTLADLIAKAGLAGGRQAAPAGLRASSTNGPYVDVDGERVQAGLALAVPDLAIGMFSLQDLNFGSRLSLYFDGRPPELAIDFATVDNPFRASVSAITGGGYLGIELTTAGIRRISGVLEFGASIAIDIGIAAGRASVMAGVYFDWFGTDGLALTGYLRAEGHVEVMKIASMSLVMEIYLTYENEVLIGGAEVSFSVRLLFFRKTFRAHVERKFVGANADPTFAELMAPSDWPADQPLPWDTYCQAFAAA